MKIVYVCSPLRGDIEVNIRNAREYCRKTVAMGFIPIAPHTIYTEYLDDREPAQRRQGLLIGLELLQKCDELWAFGTVTSEGMDKEIELAREYGIPVYRIDEPDNPLNYPGGCHISSEIFSLAPVWQ